MSKKFIVSDTESLLYTNKLYDINDQCGIEKAWKEQCRVKSKKKNVKNCNLLTVLKRKKNILILFFFY